jgi:hypothetical protein
MGGGCLSLNEVLMSSRARRDRLEVHHDRAPEIVRQGSPPAAEGPGDGSEIPYVEPEEFGLRVNWQSEAVKIEAAEFLVATRVQEDQRRRLARVAMRLRELRAERH